MKLATATGSHETGQQENDHTEWRLKTASDSVYAGLPGTNPDH